VVGSRTGVLKAAAKSKYLSGMTSGESGIDDGTCSFVVRTELIVV
jgi:hypothetical protein